MTNSIANQEQAAFWGGDRGQAWADAADRYDAQLERYGLLAVSTTAPLPGDTVLDIGCGTGSTTFECAKAVGPTGHVVGLDISAAMLSVAEAKRAAGGHGNVSFLEADVQTLEPFDRPVDTIVSRFGVMFFSDPVEAFRRLARTAKDRARLGFVCWGPLTSNEWVAVPAVALEPLLPLTPPLPADAPGPFAFGDQERVERILNEAGWDQVTFEVIDDPVYLGGPGTVDDAVRFVLDASSLGMHPNIQARRTEAEAILAEALAPRHDGTGVKFHANAHAVRALKA